MLRSTTLTPVTKSTPELSIQYSDPGRAAVGAIHRQLRLAAVSLEAQAMTPGLPRQLAFKQAASSTTPHTRIGSPATLYRFGATSRGGQGQLGLPVPMTRRTFRPDLFHQPRSRQAPHASGKPNASPRDTPLRPSERYRRDRHAPAMLLNSAPRYNADSMRLPAERIRPAGGLQPVHVIFGGARTARPPSTWTNGQRGEALPPPPVI